MGKKMRVCFCAILGALAGLSAGFALVALTAGALRASVTVDAGLIVTLTVLGAFGAVEITQIRQEDRDF